MKNMIAIVAVAGLASAANAQTWSEIDSGGYQARTDFGLTFENFDAGKLLSNANVTDGLGALSEITGFLHYGYDVDMYKIQITNAASFSATGSANWSYSLALFAADGTAVAYNGDNADVGIQAQIDSTLVAGAGNGVYYLAVIDNAFDATVHAWNAAGGDIFDLTDLSLQNAPVAGDAVLGLQDDFNLPGPWDHTETTSTIFSSSRYSIALTGAGYAVPAPSSLALLGLGGLAVTRRRR